MLDPTVVRLGISKTIDFEPICILKSISRLSSKCKGVARVSFEKRSFATHLDQFGIKLY